LRHDVRFGSKAEVAAPNFDFRFTPESGLNSDSRAISKSATIGLTERSGWTTSDVSARFGNDALAEVSGLMLHWLPQ
jgi:hypothetical protein